MKNEIERAKDALFSLDASCPRTDWVAIGMAAKSAGLVFTDFHNWSSSGSNYVSEKDCQNTWKSFKSSSRITVATLFKHAIEQGWKDNSYIKNKSSNKAVYSGKQNQQVVKANETCAKSNNINAEEIWKLCDKASSDHNYISSKKGNADGLRVYPSSEASISILGQNVAGYLVVPCWSDGILQTLQFIPPNEGKKLNQPGASFNDGYFTIGKIVDTAYICEGIGAAWSCAACTGKAAVVCFGSGRMKTVAEKLHLLFPKCNLVLVPDQGKESQAEAIATVINGSFVKMPSDKNNNYDANDFAAEFGGEALRDLLYNQRNTQPMRFKLLSGEELYNAPAMQWLIRGLLPKTGLAALYGPSGSGKSFLMLDIACAIAGGHHD